MDGLCADAECSGDVAGSRAAFEEGAHLGGQLRRPARQRRDGGRERGARGNGGGGHGGYPIAGMVITAMATTATTARRIGGLGLGRGAGYERWTRGKDATARAVSQTRVIDPRLCAGAMSRSA